MMLMLGQWTYFSKDALASFGQFIWPFVVLISIYLIMHFRFSKPIIWRELKRQSKTIIGFGLFFFLIGFAQVRYLSLTQQSQVLPQELDGSTALVTVLIDDVPKASDKGEQANASVLDWHLPDNPALIKHVHHLPKRLSIAWYLPYSARSFNPSHDVKSSTSQRPVIQPGQVWQLTLKLKRPRSLKNPHVLDLEQWQMMQGLGAGGFVVGTTGQLVQAWQWSFAASVAKLRQLIKQKVLDSLGPSAPYAGVISALVMGDQQAIPAKDWEVFNATGIGHLISISGLHVTMLASFGAYLANMLWRRSRLSLLYPRQKVAALVGFVTALLYTFLAGFQIPAQRTMLMVGMVGVYLYLNRTPKAFDIWWWAMAMVVLLDPWAVFTPGFSLSFGAVAAILYAMPPKPGVVYVDIDLLLISKLKKSLLEACHLQAVVTIALIPISLWWFYQISLIAPLANAIAIPVVSLIVTPLAMLGVVFPWWLGDCCLWLAHFFFSLIATCLQPMAGLSWATLSAAKPSSWGLAIGIFGVILAIAPGSNQDFPLWGRTWLIRVIGLICCLSLLLPRAWLFGNGVAADEVRMLVWDIGQGSAVLIETQHHTLLYDTGPISGRFDPGMRVILPHLRASGIGQIDQLLISHQDADHVGGLPSILANFKVSHSIATIAGDHPLHQEYRLHQVPITPCQAGHS